MESSDIRPKVVLLTGEMGSGKSAVRKMFEALGVPAIDADAIAKEVQVPGSDCVSEIEMVFPGVINGDGTLDRAKLRNIVANDDQANRWLVEIMTPHVMAKLEEWTLSHKDAMYVIWESALIRYGTPGIDRTCIVSANTGDQLQRIHTRNPDWSQDQIMGFLKQQRRTIYMCNDVISNTASLEDLKWEVNQLHEAYDKLWERKNESSSNVDG